ncbi:MAG: hypothetical protein AAGG01_01075 [Planctomycetota bacterium]
MPRSNAMEPASPPSLSPSASALRAFWRTVVACLIVWLAWTVVSPAVPEAGGADEPWRSATTHTWGWDEAMHAELPAVQMLLHVKRGEAFEAAEVLHECDRYPFLYPVALAGWQAVFGIGEAEARMLGRAIYGLLVLLAIRLAFLITQRGDGETERSLGLDVALLVALAALSSPLARRYAPTLFLEIPAVTMIAASLGAWIWRRGLAVGATGRRRRDLLAGALVIGTFFTKFNYALMLGLALGLDALVEIVVGWRQRELKGVLRSLVWTGVPVLVGLVWWFFLPLPLWSDLGAEVAAEHRNDFGEFISGNQTMTMAWWLRRVNWVTGVAVHPFAFGTLVLLSIALGALVRNRIVLTLTLTLVAFVVPVLLHPFQLDRFLIPSALILWVMGGASAAMLLHRRPRAFTLATLGLTGAAIAVPVFQVTAWAGLPVAPEGSQARRYQKYHVGTTLGVFGPPASNGLTRDVHGELLDMVADAVGPENSVGWLGQSAEISPAALHLGLLERGGSAERFLEFAEGPMDIELLPSNVRVDYSDEAILEYARQFDHVIVPSQGDLVGRPGRAWIPEAWHGALRRSSDVTWRTLGSVLVDRSNDGPFPVTIELASTAGLRETKEAPR